MHVCWRLFFPMKIHRVKNVDVFTSLAGGSEVWYPGWSEVRALGIPVVEIC